MPKREDGPIAHPAPVLEIEEYAVNKSDASHTPATDSLSDLIRLALQSNPRLRSQALQVEAALAKIPQASALPDPMLGTIIYGHPIETAAGSMRANVTLSQRFPWFPRLKAQEQRAVVEASMMQEKLRAESLMIIGDLKSLYYRLYLLGQQIRINEENQKALASIIRIELKRVGTSGKKTAINDTYRSSVEKSRLEQALIDLQQQRTATVARLNALLHRPPTTPINTPTEIDIDFQSVELPQVAALTEMYQPVLIAAQLRSEAARLGIEIADLLHVPDVSLSVGWWAIDDNRPATRIVDVGNDAWAVGVSINIPLWHKKYEAARQEARATHASTLANIDDLQSKYQARLADLSEKAKAAKKIMDLYNKSILPQARATLSTDRKSYGAGEVDFDRLMNDFRNLILLEVNYHQSKTELATAIARLEQTIGLSWDKVRQAFKLDRKK